jgi:hypothetical protein
VRRSVAISFWTCLSFFALAYRFERHVHEMGVFVNMEVGYYLRLYVEGKIVYSGGHWAMIVASQ